MAALNKTIQLVGDKILKRSCGLTRMLSCSNALKRSKIVESEVMDLQLPNLTFHDMCWKQGGQVGEKSGSGEWTSDINIPLRQLTDTMYTGGCSERRGVHHVRGPCHVQVIWSRSHQPRCTERGCGGGDPAQHAGVCLQRRL